MRDRTYSVLFFISIVVASGAQVHEAHAAEFDSIGVTQGEGTHFQISDSDYLNVTLESVEVITLRMKSVPEMITMRIAPTSALATSTQITITGFLPHTTYYKYEDNYHNLAEILSDENGAYAYTQDISKSHRIFIQPRKSTKFISNGATGGGCASIGTWDPATLTCTLANDLTETVQIDSDGITLDGGGHAMTGSNTGNGIYLYEKSGVTVRNLTIKNFSYGITLDTSPNNAVHDNNISVDIVSGNRYTGETLTLYDSNNNEIYNNAFSKADEELTLYNSSGNTIRGNTFSEADEALTLYTSNDNEIYNNNFINNNTHLTDYRGVRNTFNLAEPKGGNYFDTFDEPTEGCDDANLDGFCDAPYIVYYTSGQDNLPWTKRDGWKIPPAPQISNVLFLPGLEASRLYRPDYAGGTDKLWEPFGDSDAGDLSMNANGTAVRDDIYTRDAIDNAYLPVKGDVYKSFFEQLDTMKNVDGVIADYGVAPYDWRLQLEDILESGAELSGGRLYYSGPLGATSTPYIIQELRRLAASSKTGKVTIIAHSNGGLLAKALTGKLGAEASQLIDKIIFVAVPQAGTPKAVGALLHGFEQALPIKPLSLFGMSEATARELARNMPSVYNLLPSANYFTYVDDPVVTFSDDPLLAPWRSAYGDAARPGVIHSGELLHSFLTDQARAVLPTSDPLTAPIIGNEALLNASEAVHATQDSWTPPSGIELVEIAGWGMPTLKTIAYYEGVKNICTLRKADSTCAAMTTTPVLEYKPETVLDGDGTVVVPSALWTPNVQKYWVDLKSYGATGIRGSTINRKHADILEIPQLRTFIQNLITSVDTGSTPEFIYTSSPLNPDLEDRLNFILHSPLTLDLYDDIGNHTGFSSTTNSLEENIPDSHFLTFGEVQYVSVPSSANIRLIMNGYADGSFTFDIEEVQEDIVVATTTFSGIPSFTNTKVEMDIPADAGIEGASPLRVDVQGDGAVDVALEPKLNGTVILRMPLTVTAKDKKIVLGDPTPPFTTLVTDALGAALTDNDITGTADCTTTATYTSPAGTYPITCSTGTLSSEKYEFSTFVPGTLTIQYKWDGFSQPINDVVYQVGQSKSVFKGGSTIPVKFQLKKSDGTPVQANIAPVWLTPQRGLAMNSSIDESVYSVSGTSGAVYKWDSIAQQYVYNWSTKGLTAGYWYTLYAKLDDDNTYSVTVGLR